LSRAVERADEAEATSFFRDVSVAVAIDLEEVENAPFNSLPSRVPALVPAPLREEEKVDFADVPADLNSLEIFDLIPVITGKMAI
jgi:hypothetical protein